MTNKVAFYLLHFCPLLRPTYLDHRGKEKPIRPPSPKVSLCQNKKNNNRLSGLDRPNLLTPYKLRMFLDSYFTVNNSYNLALLLSCKYYPTRLRTEV